MLLWFSRILIDFHDHYLKLEPTKKNYTIMLCEYLHRMRIISTHCVHKIQKVLNIL